MCTCGLWNGWGFWWRLCTKRSRWKAALQILISRRPNRSTIWLIHIISITPILFLFIDAEEGEEDVCLCSTWRHLADAWTIKSLHEIYIYIRRLKTKENPSRRKDERSLKGFSSNSSTPKDLYQQTTPTNVARHQHSYIEIHADRRKRSRAFVANTYFGDEASSN